MSRWGTQLGLAVITALAATGCVAPSLSEHGVSDDCREPPWFPRPAPDGVRAESCADGRSFRFVLGSGPFATESETHTFLDAHRDELHAIEGLHGSGLGVCCREDLDDPRRLQDPCVSLDVLLCTTSLPEVVDTVRGMQARDATVARRSLRVSVALSGLTEPRCRAEDPNCGPIPYQERAPGPVPESRTPVPSGPAENEPCAHDGECVTDGCGNACTHWTSAGLAGTCPLLGELVGAFCGCAQDRCQWFK